MALKHAETYILSIPGLLLKEKIERVDEMEMNEGPDWPSDNFSLAQMEFSVRFCHVSCSLLVLMELSK